MKRLTLSPEWWRVSVALVMLVIAAAPGSGTLPTQVRYVTAATIQDPPLSDADEQWVQQEAVSICDEINSSDNREESCDFGPESLTLPLAACLRFAFANTSLDLDTARATCRSYVRNSGGFGPRMEFPGDEILVDVNQRVTGQIAIFQEAGVSADALGPLGADLWTCLITQSLNPDPLSSNDTPRRSCRSAYESPDLHWVAALTQTYSAELLQRGIGGADVFDLENRFGGCVRRELSSAADGRGYLEAEAWRAIPNRCRDELAGNLVVGGPPTVESLSCTPTMVDRGGMVSCTATLGGTTEITTRRWLAPGGGPADGRGEGFSTSFSEPGMRAITFRACNGTDPDDDPATNRAACVEQSRSIEVRSTSAPTIASVSCSPQSVAPSELVTCTATIDGTVTSSRWVALDGNPSGGDGMPFTTRFSSAGGHIIVLAACNGTLCATVEQTVTVTGPAATATPTTQTTTLSGTFALNQQDASGACSFSRAPQTNGTMTMTVNADAGTFSASMRGRGEGTRNAVRCDNVTKDLRWRVDYTVTVSGSFDRATGRIEAGAGQLQGTQTGTYSNCRRTATPPATPVTTCPAPITYSDSYSDTIILSGTIGAASGVASGTLTGSGTALTTTGSWNASR